MADAVERRSRITIIEDHAELRDLMCDVLSSRYEVTAFSHRALGPDELLATRPDLLIVDFGLGGLEHHDWNAVTLVRSHQELHEVPIIVCSGDIDSLGEDAETVLSAGNTAILTKPFTLETLEDTVGQGLSAGFPGGFDPRNDGRDGYHSLLQDAVHAILVADRAGRYIDANDVALGLLRLTREQLRERAVADVVALDRAWTDAEWQRYRQRGWWHGRVTLSLPHGGTVRMLATARVIEDRDGEAYVSWLQPVEEGSTRTSA